MHQQTYHFENFIVTFSTLYDPIFLPFQAKSYDAGFDLRVRVANGMSSVQIQQDLMESTWGRQEYFFLNGKKHRYDQAKLGQMIEEERGRAWVKIPSNQTVLVPTGLRWQVSIKDYDKCERILAWFIYPRSGLASKCNLSLANNVGVVDMGYPEEVCLALENRSSYDHYLSEGTRAAQGVLTTVFNLGMSTETRASGFGHTGV